MTATSAMSGWGCAIRKQWLASHSLKEQGLEKPRDEDHVRHRRNLVGSDV